MFGTRRGAGVEKQGTMRCSFCNKRDDEIQKLIAGPSVCICDECIGVCNDIIADDAARQPGHQPVAAVREAARVADAAGVPSTATIPCALCGIVMPWQHGLPVVERGMLCPGCVGEVEAAIARSREAGAEGKPS